jgi:serine/threonine protein phosphatase PrpC
MGLCISCNSRIEDNICYYEDIVLYIKERDRLGKVFRSDKVHFKVSAPVYTQCDELDLQKMKINVSSCVINGMDPRLVLNKECQDNLMYLQKDEVFLTAVFDGHGIEGLRVVDYTKDYIKKYFTQNSNAFKTAPLETITYMITECDKKLRNPSSGIDCSISGTTAVVLVISDTLHIGSVGDSKAILAILGAADPNYIPSKRYIEPSRQLFPMKLTADQRPNIRQELERIKKAGGKVQQLTNEQGQKIGPYRVWKKKGTLPGLAMSRSIGDSIGKEIGVISNPICNSFLIDKTTDLFIVLATDGIWDVMDSTEVINFVDKFRKICKKVVEPINYPIKVIFS